MSALNDLRPPRQWKLSAAVWLLSTIAFFGVYASAVLTAEGQTVENSALGASSYGNQWRVLLNLVSVPNIAAAVVVLALLGLTARRPRAAVRVVGMIVAANVLTQLLKYAVLSRPDLQDVASDNTFPSGHTVVFASVFLGLLMVVPVAVRPIAALLSALMLGIIAFQLLEFGWHRASDVVGGALLVVAMLALAHLLLPDRATTPLPRSTGANRVILRGLLFTSIVGIIAGGGFTGVLAIFPNLATTTNLLIATQIICVTTTTSAVVITLALQRTSLALHRPFFVRRRPNPPIA